MLNFYVIDRKALLKKDENKTVWSQPFDRSKEMPIRWKREEDLCTGDIVFHYVKGNHVGPKEEDINTMHRYRDSIVVERAGAYERRAFGAYVLFPWHDEVAYAKHPLYESINTVNIGGLPFLPNATSLVEQIIDSLLNKTADELQQQGILPVGARDRYLYEVKGGETGPYLAADIVKEDNERY